MIIVYNLSGLVLAATGFMAGLFVFTVSGWLSPALLTVAVIWFVGGFWWRNQEVSPGVKRQFPAVYFIPLPFLAIPVACLGALSLLVIDLGARSQLADRRVELFRADERLLDSGAATGDVGLSQKILAVLPAVPVDGKNAATHVTTRRNGDAVLVLVKAPALKSYQDKARKALLQQIADILRADEQLKDNRIFIGIKGRLTYGAIQTPPNAVEIGSVVDESQLYDFYNAPVAPPIVPQAGSQLAEEHDSRIDIPAQRAHSNDVDHGADVTAKQLLPNGANRVDGESPDHKQPPRENPAAVTSSVDKTASRAQENTPGSTKTPDRRAPRAQKDEGVLRTKEDKTGGAKPTAPTAVDAQSGEFRRFTEMRWGVKSLAFSPTAGLLAAGKPDQALVLFDVDNNARLVGLDKLRTLKSVTSCLFTPDGSHLLAGGSTGHIQVYELSQKGQLKESAMFVGHSQEVTCLAVSGDGQWAVSGGKEKKLRCWEVATGRELAAFPGCQGPIKACFIAKSGSTALATDGATLLTIDLKKRDITRRRQLASSWASGQAAAFSSDGEQVAVGDRYSVRLWNLNSRDGERPKLEDNEIQWSMAFTPDGTRLLCGGNGKVNVWDVHNGKKIHALHTARGGYIQSLAVSPDNKLVAAIPSSAGQDLQVFRLDPGDQATSLSETPPD